MCLAATRLVSIITSIYHACVDSFFCGRIHESTKKDLITKMRCFCMNALFLIYYSYQGIGYVFWVSQEKNILQTPVKSPLSLAALSSLYFSRLLESWVVLGM